MLRLSLRNAARTLGDLPSDGQDNAIHCGRLHLVRFRAVGETAQDLVGFQVDGLHLAAQHDHIRIVSDGAVRISTYKQLLSP